MLFNIRAGFSQNGSVEENYSRAGGLKLVDGGFGVFGAAAHVNKDTTFTDYVPYYAKFALWVGAKNAKGEIKVTAGTGNEITSRPEWARDTKSVNKNPSFQQVERIAATTYSDAVAFEGHEPLGLLVTQEEYGFNNTRFAIVTFTISLDENAETLNDVYLGLSVDIDAADRNNNLTLMMITLVLAPKALRPLFTIVKSKELIFLFWARKY